MVNIDLSKFELLLNSLGSEYGIEIFRVNIADLNPDEAVVLRCQIPLCEYYGICKVCPPFIPSVDTFRKSLAHFKAAFLLALSAPAGISLAEYRHNFQLELKLLNFVHMAEKTAFEHGCYRAMGLVVGGCKLCVRCTPPGQPCRHPYRARPSPEGFGVDLTALAQKAGIPIQWPPKEKVYFLGLLLV